MKNYESYVASYPLAYYDLGTIYSFYGHKDANIRNITTLQATPDQIKKYAPILQEMEVDQINLKEKMSGFSGCYKDILDRYYAVIVDKVSAGPNSYITAMFCNKADGKLEYYTRKYAVDSMCLTDAQNYLPIAAHLNYSFMCCHSEGSVEKTVKTMKVGGITKAELNNKVGGITRATNESDSVSTSVGGITLAHEKKIGGITKA